VPASDVNWLADRRSRPHPACYDRLLQPGQGAVEQLDDGGRHASDARRSALRVSRPRGSLRARRSR
jgi:hypothetical protein